MDPVAEIIWKYLESEKDNFILNYNLKLHGGREDKSLDVTLPDDSEWIEKV